MTLPVRVGLAALVVLTLGPASIAGAASPTATLRAFFDEANRIVSAPDLDLTERRTAVRTLAERVFDFSGAAAATLGPAWGARTPTERAEFVQLFTDLIENGYVTLVGNKARITGGVTVRYLEEVAEGDAATVRTTLLTRGGDELSVEYRMARRRGRWTVRDVVIDGMSLIANYRAQFQRILQTSSYDDLATRLRARTSRGDRLLVGLADEPAPQGVAVASPETGPALDSRPPELATSTARPPTAPAGPPEESRQIRVEPRPLPAVESAPKRPAPPAPATATLVRESAAPGETSPAARAAAPVAAPPYWIQVGTVRSPEAVVRLLERLREHPAVAVFGAARELVVRVLVGPFADRGQAAAKLRELRASGVAAFIAERAD